MQEELEETLEQQEVTPNEDNDELASIDDSEESLVDEAKRLAAEAEKETEPQEADSGEEEAVKVEEEIVKPSTHRLKNKDIEIDVTLEELIAMGNKHLDYTRKTQELAKHRSKVDYMATNNIDMNDLHRLADLKSGKKEVISQYAKELGIDLYDVDEDAQYVPSTDKAYREPTDVDNYISSITSSNPELTNRVNDFAKSLPQDFREAILSSVGNLEGFVSDVENGIAAKAKPIADRIYTLNPNKSYMEAYLEAYNYLDDKPVVKENTVVVPTADKSRVGKPSSSTTPNTGLDIWDDGLSDEALIERIKQQANRFR